VLRGSFGASNSPLPHRWPTPPPPLPQKLPIAPIFIADSVSLAVSREKDGKLRINYPEGRFAQLDEVLELRASSQRVEGGSTPSLGGALAPP
jgi:hypothetical protein